MVVLRLQGSARTDSHQDNWSNFEAAGGQGDPGGYTESVSGREKATTWGFDLDVEDCGCCFALSFHLHRCLG